MNQTLQKELTAIVGERFVLTQPADLMVYSFDSALDRAIPTLVVLPGTAQEVAKIVKLLAHHKEPFVARGAGTSLCGGPIAIKGGVVIGLARLNKIGALDKTKHEIHVEPGVVNLKLQNVLEQDKLFFAPDPGSQKACTIGGNVASNAGGPHCLKYGVTSNHVQALEIVLPDGQVTQLSVTDPGFDVLGFFVGSEGTLGIATGITLKVLPKPKYIQTIVVSFSSMEAAIQSVTDIIAEGILPATLEAMDKTIVQAVEAFIHAGYPTDAEAVLLIEVDGNRSEELDDEVKRIRIVCEKNNHGEFRFAKDEAERKKLWEGRRGSYAAMARLAPNVLVEDGAVPRTKLPEALREIKAIGKKAGLQVALLFHAGDGNLHPQIIFDERDKTKTAVVKNAGYQMLKACVDLGGTISGEHGIGLDKREAMKWLFSRETLSLFRRLKNAFDPHNLCNPDKLIPLVGKSERPVTEKKTDQIDQVSTWGAKEPASEQEAVDLVRSWVAEKKLFGVQGTASKHTVKQEIILKTGQLNRITDLDKGNLTVTVQAGILVADLKNVLKAEGLHLWIADSSGTLGGLIATRASTVPPLRDQILGMRVLLATGEVVVFGAKTMKNVAGYDCAKLLIGSWGTLGVVLDVTFRLFPFAPPKLLSEIVSPFVMKELHRRIKRAFDPLDLLYPRYHDVASGAKITVAVERPIDPSPEGKGDTRSYEERFWGSS